MFKLRHIMPPLFLVVLVASFFLSNKCPYVYGYSSLTTKAKNDLQIAEEMIDKTFKETNLISMMVPSGEYENEAKLLQELESMDEVHSVLGLANIDARGGYVLTEKISPRQFAELADLDIEMARLLYSSYAIDKENIGKMVSGIDNYGVPLIDIFLFLYDQVQEGYVTLDDNMTKDIEKLHDDLIDAKKQLQGENYSMFALKLNLPEEGKETFDFLKKLHDTAEKYYGKDVYLLGNSTLDYDLSLSFKNDNILVSVLSALFVMLVLLFTFQSVGIPILLILVIQGSVWINFSFPYLANQNLYFISYLVVSSIQMGANVDYAIIITNRYSQLKKTIPIKQAMVQALNQAFPTVLTSGSILATAGFLIGRLSSDPTISSIGMCLGRGTVISIALVMAILPQLLVLGDTIIRKTYFELKKPAVIHTRTGEMRMNGHLRGYISGLVDADFSGVINGTISATLEGGNIEEKGDLFEDYLDNREKEDKDVELSIH